MTKRLRTGLLLLLPLTLPFAARADGTAEAGATVFKKCMACHAVDQPVNKIGPHLDGVIGRPAASIEGFAYSEALKKAAADGLVWDEANLGQYLANPRTFMPGNRMSFTGLRNPQEIVDLIAYLKTMPKTN